MSKARDYKRTTIRRLDILSGNQCAQPECTKQLIAFDHETIVSKICHIEAAEPGGPRYNLDMTDDERRHYDNLILLCDECHNVIDNVVNEDKYPVILLKQWKKDHESKMMFELATNPSILQNAINAISQLEFEDEEEFITEQATPYAPAEKIEFNAIKRNKYLINEYKIYFNKINTLYAELELQGSFKKVHLLRYIKNIYLKIKGKYVANSANIHETIQANSDNIIEDIQQLLWEELEKSNVSKENTQFGIDVIMVDSFIRCKILEEPK